MGQRIVDTQSNDVDFVIEEASGEVDGKHILAKVRGPMFFPDGHSRNEGRFYSKGLWEKQLQNEEIQSKLKNRLMLGTISHDTPLNDTTVQEGKISHVVTDLRIEDGCGVGEALILGTPAGNVLNTLLRSGVKMSVSTRGSGEFSGTHNGSPKVDEDSYKLQSIDWVLEPGFSQALPSLVESYNSELQEDFKYVFSDALKLNESVAKEEVTKAAIKEAVKEVIKEEKEVVVTETVTKSEVEKIKEDKGENHTMSKELLESLAVENKGLKDTVTELTETKDAVEQTKSAIEGENKFLREKNEDYEAVKTELAAYKALAATPEELTKTIAEAVAKIKSYKEVSESGDPVALKEELTALTEQLTAYTDIGPATDITETIDGAVASLKKVKAFTEAVGEFSEVEKIVDGAVNQLKEWKEIGENPKAVSETINNATKIIKKLAEDKKAKDITALAEELSVTEEAIAKMYDKMSVADIKEVFKGVSATTEKTSSSKKIQEKFSKDKVVLKENKDKKGEVIVESQTQKLMRLHGRNVISSDAITAGALKSVNG